MGTFSTFSDGYAKANYYYGITDHAKNAKDHVGWSMAGIGADFVGLLQPLAQKGAAVGAAKFATAATTPVINGGLLTMMAMSNSCGFGEPDKGQDFARSSSAYAKVGEAHHGTESPDTWQGGASDQYADRNDEQRRRAEALAEADKTVKEVLAREAEQVDVARKMLDRCQTILNLCIPPAVALNLIPGWGPGASITFQAISVSGTLGPALTRYTELVGQAAHNATLLRRAGQTYEHIAEGVTSEQ